MAKAKTKTEIIEQANLSYDQLEELLASMTSEQINANFKFDISKEKGQHWTRDKNVRDVIMHVHDWHVLMLDWLASNLNDQPQDFLKEGYNWRTYGDMNVELWKQNQSVDYETAMERFRVSHKQVMLMFDEFSNEDLFEKNVYPWVGDTTLANYFIPATASHYVWAIKKIKKHLKSIKA